ncbi:MAG TPA: hypothetical protein VMV93_02405 [Chloroflexota bacterium]|nr:hypothetical protein [Chloroflexota bacterium]
MEAAPLGVALAVGGLPAISDLPTTTMTTSSSAAGTYLRRPLAGGCLRLEYEMSVTSRLRAGFRSAPR